MARQDSMSLTPARRTRAPRHRGVAASDSIAGTATFGWLAIILFFVVLGGWAALAPLSGAVVAQAVVKVEGNRKTVQHLDGGIVRQLRIREGDRVAEGDLLIKLDDSQARAEVEVLTQQLLALKANESRLLAEFERNDRISFPSEVTERSADPYIAALISGTDRQFRSRRAALEGQRRIAEQRIAQLREQMTGSSGVKQSLAAQISSIEAERQSLQELVQRGLVTRPRILQLERSAEQLRGQLSDVDANIAKAQEGVIEHQRQIDQLENDRMAEITRDLRDVQSRLLEVLPRLQNSRAVLERTEIRAPYGGTVVGLSVFSMGGVVSRGDRILDIVPDDNILILEAQIPVEEIAEVRPRQPAEVTFAGPRLRHIPKLPGEVVTISADRLTDNRTGASYFVAFVRIDANELKAHPGLQLYPGMAATVMLPTVERTALDYLLNPLIQALDRSFRER